mmetsp:Transcript_6577/g.12657  ORF Transcript_6577/g.12657 Transcript_6577/m.12657 type:complete len:543 (+) Transcript_6577:383-2011(+)
MNGGTAHGGPGPCDLPPASVSTSNPSSPVDPKPSPPDSGVAPSPPPKQEEDNVVEPPPPSSSSNGSGPQPHANAPSNSDAETNETTALPPPPTTTPPPAGLAAAAAKVSDSDTRGPPRDDGATDQPENMDTSADLADTGKVVTPVRSSSSAPPATEPLVPPPTTTTTSSSSSSPPPATTTTTTSLGLPPVVHVGILTVDPLKRQHVIKGLWTQPPHPSNPLATFAWKYTLPGDKALSAVPHRGRGKYAGIFKIPPAPTASKSGKAKGIDVVETIEKMEYEPIGGGDDQASSAAKEGKYEVKGRGFNKYGTFKVQGTGVVQKGAEGETDTMKIEVTKSYYTPDPNELPDPSETHDVQVTCMRGQMVHKPHPATGLGTIKITGKWSSDRLNLLVDPSALTPDQVVSDFELEHTSSQEHSKMAYPPEKTLRLSGHFMFWVQATQTHNKVGENDLSFKLVKNSAGGWNVDGRGRNAYGNFFLTGTLDGNGRDIELYKHFPPRNSQSKARSPKAAASSSSSSDLPVLLLLAACSGHRPFPAVQVPYN